MPPIGQYGTGGSYSGKMPMKATRRASSSLAGHNPLPQDPALEAEIEDFGPPEWRSVLNSRADLGYPDFYPSRPGFNQTEDVLTDEFAKNGFAAKTFVAVGAESFSMHGPIHGHLLNGGLIMLNKLGQEIAQKRTESTPQYTERNFKIPQRVTYNDVKRHQFLADLANPNIPLSRLMLTSVPHGFKGVELFETMFSPPQPPSRIASGAMASSSSSNTGTGPGPPAPPAPIPIDRALWFIRVLGANEISMHRGRAQTAVSVPVVASPMPATPSSTATAPAAQVQLVSSSDWYTGEFTTGFCGWLRNQLAQLSLPSKGNAVKSGKPGAGTVVPGAKAPVGVLGDEKARARWLAKWDYTTKMLRQMEDRQLVSGRLLVGWLVDTLATANFAQLGFILQLLGERLQDMSRQTSTARVCIRVACAKLVEIRASPAAATLVKVEEMLQNVILTLFDSNHHTLLSPSSWRQHRDVIENTIVPPVENSELAMTRPDGTLRPARPRRALLDDVKSRSDRLLFVPAVAESSTSPRRQQMQDLHTLDGMDADTDMTKLCKTYFDGSASPTAQIIDIARLEDKTFVLLNWAMGLFQLGVHRAYAVDTLLTIWSELHEASLKAAKKAGSASKPVEFFDILYKWLDTCEAPRVEENAFAIGITFGDLTRQGLFSYRRYLEMLIACGHTARARRPGQAKSHHIPLLAAMPIFTEARDFLHQRRLALCGDDEDAHRALQEEEERLMDDFREEVMEYVPEVFGMDRYGRSESLREVVYHPMPSAPALNRFLFLQARFWLAPAAAERLKPMPGRKPMDASTYVRVLHIFHLCNGYSTTADFLIQALVWSTDEEILDVVIDTIRRAADVWTANDKWKFLINALMDRNQAQDRRKRHHSGLADLLLELAARGRLGEDDEEEVRASIEAHPKDPVTTAVGWVDVHESTDQLRQIISTGNVVAAKSLAGKLFSRHGPFASWSTVWWSTVAKAVLAPEGAKSSAVVEATLAHLIEVDDHTDSTLDSVVLTWLEDLSVPATIDMLALKPVSGLIEILLNLVAKRRLRIVPQLLDKFAYSTWKHVASAVLASKGRLSIKHLRAIESSMTLTQQLLLTTPPNPSLPPINLRQSLVMQTERGKAFNGKNVPALIRHLPFLVVLDTARSAPSRLKKQIAGLLQGLACTPQFKAAAFRNLPILKDSFLSNEWSKPGMDAGIEAGMVDALKLIMSQGSSASNENLHALASLESSTRFSAWRWTSIVLGMRVEFKRLALRIENGEDAAEARATLNQLVHATLDRDATSDDTDLLCEAFRGIETTAAQEIIAVGLERVTALLSGMIGAESQSNLEIWSRAVDLLLRVLDSAAAPGNVLGEHGFLAARHGLIEIISVGLQAVERQMAATMQGEGQGLHVVDGPTPLPDGLIPPKPMDLFNVLLRIIKFVLGLQVVEATSPVTPRPDFGRLAAAYVRVLAIIANSTRDIGAGMGDNGAEQTIAGLADVLIYIVDSAPTISRSLVHSALLAEMVSPPLLDAMQHPAISRALPYIPKPSRPVALVNANLGSEGEEGSVQLDDRPWEMIEMLDPPGSKRKTPHGELFLGYKGIVDTASVPIQLFRAVMKRDEVPGRRSVSQSAPGAGAGENGEAKEEEEEEEDGPSWTDYASERNLGDGFAGEPMAVRQLVTGLYISGDAGERPSLDDTKADGASPTGIAATTKEKEKAATSPVAGTTVKPRRASVRSTTSNQTARSALAQAAAGVAGAMNGNGNVNGNGSGNGNGAKGTSKDPFEIDYGSSSSDSSSAEDSSEDDVALADRPPGKRARVGGKGVGRAMTGPGGPGSGSVAGGAGAGPGAGGSGVRRTTGGKGVGKTVGRTGGKSVAGSGSGAGAGGAGPGGAGRRGTGGKSVGRTGGKMPGKRR